MGHKVHPYGFRLGVTRTWTAKWFHDKEYTDLLKEDISIRQLVEKRLANASVSGLEVERNFGQVTVTVESTNDPGELGPSALLIVVDDDGVGLDAEARGLVARRGRRLDESKPGSGLGLSIVTDLAGTYGGSFALDESPLGGLRAILRLPGGRADARPTPG